MSISSDGSSKDVRQFEFKPVLVSSNRDVVNALWREHEDEDRQDAPHLPPASEPVGRDTDVTALIQKAREEGRHEGESSARLFFEKELERERLVLAQALNDFADERHRYKRDVEAEVVRLALMIARRVLRREAQVDKQLLVNVVRAALDELEETTRVDLRVHPSMIQDWEEFFSRTALRFATPTISPDPTIASDACRIITSAGTTDLNIEGALGEIEQGFFDLLENRTAQISGPFTVQ